MDHKINMDRLDLITMTSTMFVAPMAIGNGQGGAPSNAACYTDSRFWEAVQSALSSGPVKVIIVDGVYRSPLQLVRLGHPSHTLQLVAQSSSVVFSAAARLDVRGSQNIDLDGITFRDFNRVSYALRIGPDDTRRRTANINVLNCSFVDLQNIAYGATGVHHSETEYVRYEGCTFKRVGSDSGDHMMYHSYGPRHISIVRCHFEDCAGTSIKFRAGADYGSVDNCTFLSTGDYINPSKPFIHYSANNSTENRDETFGSNFTFTNNTFVYAGPRGRAIWFCHYGHNPPGRRHLLSHVEGKILETGSLEQRTQLLTNNRIFNPRRIKVYGNRYSNASTFVLQSTAFFFPWDGWEGSVNVFDLINHDDQPQAKEWLNSVNHLMLS